jgi:hypothetical protein
MPGSTRRAPYVVLAALVVAAPVWIGAQQAQPPAQQPATPPRAGGGGGQQSGNYNPDGSLRPSGRNGNLFTQGAYTEYALLEPGSSSFRIRYIFENARAGTTEMTNDTRGGSEGSGVEAYDPRTGQPVKFVYEPIPGSDDGHRIRATLPRPVPQGGIGRLLIYKTYKDERTFQMNGQDLVWVRLLSGYRLGVILPKGYAFVSSSIAAQLSTTADGRLKLAFANPNGQGNEFTIHARKTNATFQPQPYTDVFFDDMRTLYDLDAPETGRIKVEQTYSDYRKGANATLSSLSYLALQEMKVIDLDTAEALTPSKQGNNTVVKLGVPITDDKQSAHLQLTGTLVNSGYKLVNGELVFERPLHGLRNTVLLPAGWEVSGASQSGTIGTYQGRSFIAFVNLNAENNYAVTIRARKQ